MARRIVREILTADPGNVEARELLESWRGRSGKPQARELEETPEAPTAAAKGELSGRFRAALARPDSRKRERIQRLERWLERVQRRARA